MTHSIKARFDGDAGKQNRIDALKKQVLINGNDVIANAIAEKVELSEFNKGAEIIKQGNLDSEMYFIISGSVRIRINETHIGTRNEKHHVGEMVVLDPAQKRSATVTAEEYCLLAQIKECDFTVIANNYPILWRNIAIELANRLRERSKSIQEPNPKPIIFIGSSSEQFEVADAIKTGIQGDSIKVKTWKDSDVFNPSHTAIESLVKEAHQADFAILLASPDDIVKIRGRKHYVPRDNILFEIGLFMGRIGRERTFIILSKGRKNTKMNLLGAIWLFLTARDIKLPTDLLGVNLRYFTPNDESSINDICTELHHIIEKNGPKQKEIFHVNSY